MGTLVPMEPTLKYHPWFVRVLTSFRESGRGTVLGGQFDWGGRLPKSNGGVQRSAQAGRKSAFECKGISRLNCEAYRPSRWETRS